MRSEISVQAILLFAIALALWVIFLWGINVAG